MICNVCNEDKDVSCFEHQRQRPNPRKTCKQCRYNARDKEKEKIRHRAYAKKRRAEHPDVIRRLWERAVYGVCKEDLGEQKCKICNKTSQLHIDHCHTTNKVRGLLCHSCNIGLGMFRDKPELLENAKVYLQSFRDGPHFELDRTKYP